MRIAPWLLLLVCCAKSQSPVATKTSNAPVKLYELAGFSTPESIIFDDANDRYLVSNINGGPTDTDNNGFISIVTPDGKFANLKWIAGGVGGVTLDAPKGLAISNGSLYVADISFVRKFDLKTGAPQASIAIPGAKFLNDIAVGWGTEVYVSDTDTESLWRIDHDVPDRLANGGLGGPNGVHGSEGHTDANMPHDVYVVTFHDSRMYSVPAAGSTHTPQDRAKLPAGQLDGVVHVGDTWFVSSWEAEGVYRGTDGGPFELVLSGLRSPADIGFDTKRSRLLVPLFLENKIVVFEVK